jgi:phosphomannomutase
MAYKIKFGTDGWREIIADNYTVDNVKRVAQATAEWALSLDKGNKIVLGYDCRFGGQMFAEATAAILAENGLHVYMAESFVSTPMVSLANIKLGAAAGVIITASHNPPSYNGFKIKADFGGPALPEEVSRIESLIKDEVPVLSKSFSEYLSMGRVEYNDLESLYLNQVRMDFDVELINSKRGTAYDAMYGAGQNVIRTLLPSAALLHCEHNPGFDNLAPEPILKNLKELSFMISSDEDIQSGLATDGDADRIGFFDSKGNFVDSHHIILLLMKYLREVKGMGGKIVKSFSVSDKVQKMADILGLETVTTKIGFKYICRHMVESDVLIGAEESGGIAIKGHVPERDGIWIGMVLWQYMAETGKTVEELIQEVYDQVGSFAVERYDLRINEELKQSIINTCKNNPYQSFGNYQVTRIEDIDGFKFHFNNDQWVMIRPSGTEPVLRVYAESSDSQNAFAILDTVKEVILS